MSWRRWSPWGLNDVCVGGATNGAHILLDVLCSHNWLLMGPGKAAWPVHHPVLCLCLSCGGLCKRGVAELAVVYAPIADSCPWSHPRVRCAPYGTSRCLQVSNHVLMAWDCNFEYFKGDCLICFGEETTQTVKVPVIKSPAFGRSPQMHSGTPLLALVLACVWYLPKWHNTLG